MFKILIALIGISGSGKSTIANRLQRKYGYVSAKSYTTRPIRTECEEDELTHTFITPDQVNEYKNDIVAYNRYNGYEYFATRQMLNEADLYVVDAAGLQQLRENYHDKNVLAIFIDCDSSIASRRMSKRGDSDEAIMQRLQHDAEAFKGVREMCDFVCDNSTQEKMNDIVEFIKMLFEYKR